MRCHVPRKQEKAPAKRKEKEGTTTPHSTIWNTLPIAPNNIQSHGPQESNKASYRQSSCRVVLESALLDPPAQVHNVLPDRLRHLDVAHVHVSQRLGPSLGVGHGQVYQVSGLDVPRVHDGGQRGQVQPRIGIV